MGSSDIKISWQYPCFLFEEMKLNIREMIVLLLRSFIIRTFLCPYYFGIGDSIVFDINNAS